MLAGCNASLPNLTTPPPTSPSPTPSIAADLPSPIATPAIPSQSTPALSPAATDLERQLKAAVVQQTDLPIDRVSCPSPSAPTSEDSVTCQAFSGEQVFPIVLQQRDASGQLEWTATDLLQRSKLEDAIRQAVQQRSGLAVTADCGGKSILMAKPGDSLECQITDSQGASRRVKVTLKDRQGNVDFSLI
jgi:hypothetical protein